jgi:hypothetical protein
MASERTNIPLLDDPWTSARIDAALEPYARVLGAAELAWMREQLALTLTTDEAAAELLRRAHPHAVDQSGEVARGGAADDSGSKTRDGAG